MQVSLDLTPELHHKIESTANSTGKSISDFILDKVLIGLDEEKASMDFKNFIEPRIDEAKRGGLTEESFDEIVEEEFKKALDSQQ